MGILKMLGIEETVLYRALLALALIYGSVIIAVATDLWAGLKKAKTRGEMRTSYGLRKTTDKLSRYGNLLLSFMPLDIILFVCNLTKLPFATAIIAGYIVFIEIKSVFEKAEDKKKIEAAILMTGKVLKNKGDIEEISNIVTEYIRQKTEANDK